MKLGQVIGQVNWVDMELIASLFLLYRKNGGIISSSMSGFLEYCYWIFQILKINKNFFFSEMFNWVGVGLGGTMVEGCITAHSKNCSLAPYLHAQQQGLEFRQGYSSE